MQGPCWHGASSSALAARLPPEFTHASRPGCSVFAFPSSQRLIRAAMNDQQKTAAAAKPGGNDYSKTLYLPQTEFPMRAGLPQREPEILKRWEEIGLYEKLRKAS